MIRGFYTAGSGLMTQQTGIDNVANNLANLNTTGYKKQSIRFADLLNSNLATPDDAVPQNLKVGNGTKVSDVSYLQTQGTMQYTGNILDFAIASDGFFGVRRQDGTIGFTRDGSFSISSEATGDYLVTASGGYVLDYAGNKLLLNENSINEVGVFDFANPYELIKAGDNLFDSSVLSGEPVAIAGNILNGTLELSNVSLSDEMADLISMQKAYQFNAKMIQTADEIENIINNLR